MRAFLSVLLLLGSVLASDAGAAGGIIEDSPYLSIQPIGDLTLKHHEGELLLNTHGFEEYCLTPKVLYNSEVSQIYLWLLDGGHYLEDLNSKACHQNQWLQQGDDPQSWGVLIVQFADQSTHTKRFFLNTSFYHKRQISLPPKDICFPDEHVGVLVRLIDLPEQYYHPEREKFLNFVKEGNCVRRTG